MGITTSRGMKITKGGVTLLFLLLSEPLAAHTTTIYSSTRPTPAHHSEYSPNTGVRSPPTNIITAGVGSSYLHWTREFSASSIPSSPSDVLLEEGFSSFTESFMSRTHSTVQHSTRATSGEIYSSTTTEQDSEYSPKVCLRASSIDVSSSNSIRTSVESSYLPSIREISTHSITSTASLVYQLEDTTYFPSEVIPESALHSAAHPTICGVGLGYSSSTLVPCRVYFPKMGVRAPPPDFGVTTSVKEGFSSFTETSTALMQLAEQGSTQTTSRETYGSTTKEEYSQYSTTVYFTTPSTGVNGREFTPRSNLPPYFDFDFLSYLLEADEKTKEYRMRLNATDPEGGDLDYTLTDSDGLEPKHWNATYFFKDGWLDITGNFTAGDVYSLIVEATDQHGASAKLRVDIDFVVFENLSVCNLTDANLHLNISTMRKGMKVARVICECGFGRFRFAAVWEYDRVNNHAVGDYLALSDYRWIEPRHSSPCSADLVLEKPRPLKRASYSATVITMNGYGTAWKLEVSYDVAVHLPPLNLYVKEEMETSIRLGYDFVTGNQSIYWTFVKQMVVCWREEFASEGLCQDMYNNRLTGLKLYTYYSIWILAVHVDSFYPNATSNYVQARTAALHLPRLNLYVKGEMETSIRLGYDFIPGNQSIYWTFVKQIVIYWREVSSFSIKSKNLGGGILTGLNVYTSYNIWIEALHIDSFYPNVTSNNVTAITAAWQLPPLNVFVKEVMETSIHLGYDFVPGNQSIYWTFVKHIVVYWREMSSFSVKSKILERGILTGLDIYTPYFIMIEAVHLDSFCRSATSNNVTARTAALRLPPLNLYVKGKMETSIHLGYDFVPGNQSIYWTFVKQIVVYWREVTSFSVKSKILERGILTGLNVYTSYYIWIEAAHIDSFYPSVTSNYVAARTAALIIPRLTMRATKKRETSIRLGYNFVSGNQSIYWTFVKQIIVYWREEVSPVSVNGKKLTDGTLTGLKENTSYYIWIVAVHIDSFYPNSTSHVVRARTAWPRAYEVREGLPGLKFTKDLLDPKTTMFRSVAGNFSRHRDSQLGNIIGYLRSEVKYFIKGSVVVVFDIYMNGNEPEGEAILYEIVPGAFNPDDSYVWNWIIPQEMSGLRHGDFVEAVCRAEVRGGGSPTIKWFLNNAAIYDIPNARVRYSTPVIGADGIFKTTLTFTQIKASDSGILTCWVGMPSSAYNSSTIDLNVLPVPLVSILPMTRTVQSGEDLTITCLVSYPDVPNIRREPINITWLVDGAVFSPKDGQISNSGSSQILTVSGILKSAKYTCIGKNSAGEMNAHSNIAVVEDPGSNSICSAEVGENGIYWSDTVAGSVNQQSCMTGYSGVAVRHCLSTTSGATWDTPNLAKCVKEDLKALLEESTDLTGGIQKETAEEVSQKLNNITSTSTPLVAGDLTASVEVIQNLISVESFEDETTSDKTMQNIIKSASDILSETYQKDWNQVADDKPGTSTLMEAVDTYGVIVSKRMKTTGWKVVSSENILVQAKKLIPSEAKGENTLIPDPSLNGTPSWITTENGVTVPGEALYKIHGNSSVGISGVYYKTLKTFLPARVDMNDKSFRDVKSSLEINSDILSMMIEPVIDAIFDPPLNLKFKHVNSTANANVSCMFWDFNATISTVGDGSNGAWSSSGCELITTSDNSTTCECNHLTNFAILTSPVNIPKESISHTVLSYITQIGCGVSIACLLVTIIIFAIYWKKVRSSRTTILINLCISLVGAYVTFLAGVTETGNNVVCIVVAGLLHYLFLVAFFFMLLEGIELYIVLVRVFHYGDSRGKWYILSGWGVPALVVAISMGATQTEGYGNEQYCWLSVNNGVLWAFVGPALVIIVVNIVFLTLALRAMFGTKAIKDKNVREKARQGIRALFVLMPLLGITWVFGVLSVSDDTVVFQYLFTIFNSLQGLGIFVFHCLMNKQLTKHWKRRKLTTTSRTPSSSKSPTESTVMNISHPESQATSTLMSNTPPHQDTKFADCAVINPMFADNFEIPTFSFKAQDQAVKSTAASDAGVVTKFTEETENGSRCSTRSSSDSNHEQQGSSGGVNVDIPNPTEESLTKTSDFAGVADLEVWMDKRRKATYVVNDVSREIKKSEPQD